MGRGIQIVGFGAIAVDDLLFVDAPFTAGKGKVLRRATDHGGNVATALVAAARLGARTAFIGWLPAAGRDDPSTADLERSGVDTSFAPRRADAAAIRSVILVAPDGERFIAYDDHVPHGTSETLPDAALAGATLLLIDAYATVSHAVVARARALGLVVVGDFEWSVGQATLALMELCDHLVVPVRFARVILGDLDLSRLIDGLWSQDRTAVVLTDGARGAYLRQKGDPALWHVPTHNVQAIDTTGAGDCFHGAYAHALVSGKVPLDCVLFATAAAAISVTGQGGRSALPDLAACLALMASADAPLPLPLPLSLTAAPREKATRPPQ
jgi:sugar/nucleoside kinase (ribokinase family)